MGFTLSVNDMFASSKGRPWSERLIEHISKVKYATSFASVGQGTELY